MTSADRMFVPAVCVMCLAVAYLSVFEGEARHWVALAVSTAGGVIALVSALLRPAPAKLVATLGGGMALIGGILLETEVSGSLSERRGVAYGTAGIIIAASVALWCFFTSVARGWQVRTDGGEGQ